MYGSSKFDREEVGIREEREVEIRKGKGREGSGHGKVKAGQG